MLTADPEGFPLGLAELGLKKPKAGLRIRMFVTTDGVNAEQHVEAD